TGLPGADHEANWLLSRAFLQEGRIAEASSALDRAGGYRADHPLLAQPSRYVGSARCASCPPEINEAPPPSPHAPTLHPAPDLLNLPFPARPLAAPADPKVTHTFSRNDGRIEVTTSAGNDVWKAVVAYAFGSSGRYVTMIGRDAEGGFRALRLSSYPTPEGP